MRIWITERLFKFGFWSLYTIYVQEIVGVWFAVVFGEEGRIVASNFSRKGRKQCIANILKILPVESDFTEEKPKGAAVDVLRNMGRIYMGEPLKREFKFDMERLTPFIKKALLMTYKIPLGFVATYGGIAKALGNIGAARAVGQAEATNPFAPIIPCHCVVGSDLKLHGYGGRFGY